jgi:hypothetical protein
MSKKKKKQRLGAKDQAYIDNVDKMISAGESSLVIAQALNLSLASTENFIQKRVEEIKNSAGNQRIILRQLFRDAVPAAMKKLKDIVALDGMVGDVDTTTLQIRAAGEILKHAVKFIEEDTITAWIERPAFVEQKQKILQYSAQIDDSGAVTLSAETIDV